MIADPGVILNDISLLFRKSVKIDATEHPTSLAAIIRVKDES